MSGTSVIAKFSMSLRMCTKNIVFSFISTKTYGVDTKKNRLSETVLLST